MKSRNILRKISEKKFYLFTGLIFVAAVFFYFNIFRDSPEEVSTILSAHNIEGLEAGHASQNINLMAEKLGLAAVPIGAFENREIISILGGVNYKPLLIIPVAAP